MKKKLRSGYTTGACSAAAAKAATLLVTRHSSHVTEVEIPFPDGSRVKFQVHSLQLETRNSKPVASATVIKDAGDDPDVTNRAEIVAEARLLSEPPGNEPLQVIIKGGKGVGRITKPGLAISVGEPAINPVPRKMICEAVNEAIAEQQKSVISNLKSKIEITISIPEGEKLAGKTLNSRLGIIGGLSVLGTTGIVKPVSTDAWTATISSSMDVTIAEGYDEVVISAGRGSEKAHMIKYDLPEESYVLMGDYLEYSLKDAARHGFKKVHLCAQWAKMVKIAMETPQTHVRHGAIDMADTVRFLCSLGIHIPRDREFNTARQMYEYINANSSDPLDDFKRVLGAAKKYGEHITGGIPLTVYLISYEKEILVSCE